jgi:anthranilate synthase/aminodeoxychorismate synthase-like glutamine amidotransferase
MILLIDNYDSFVYNLARYFRELGQVVRVERADSLTVEEAAGLEPTHLVVSPGPCTPAEAGISTPLIRALGPTVPTLGVCLGHQCIGTAFGGRIVRSIEPSHGKTSLVNHDGTDLFDGLPSPLRVTRYHSLVVDAAEIPDELRVTARSERGEVMALGHVEHPVWGVQFHPEALLTVGGKELLANFLALGDGTPEAAVTRATADVGVSGELDGAAPDAP